jgi:alkaline phosphatase
LAKDHQRKLILLVDIKDDYKISLPLLVKELSSLNKFLSDQSKQRQLTVVISGNRPRPDEYINYPAFIFFDDDLKLSHSPNEWKRVGLVSLPLYRIKRWNGKDKFDAADSVNLKNLIDSVHQAGKPIRFWAAPDTELSWQMQMNVKVDLIGTDKINELAEFIRRQMQR